VLDLARHLLRSGYYFLKRLSGLLEVPVWKLKFELGLQIVVVPARVRVEQEERWFL
jgi:hypothetical protein